jgi:hypothetical protein
VKYASGQNPYLKQGPNQFWSTGVSAPIKNEQKISFYKVQNFLKKNASVASVGSCFATEVGNYLLDSDYKFVTHDKRRHSDSFGFGNVYSSRHLRQWLEVAFGQYDFSNLTWQEYDGKYVDLQTNLLEHFESAEALLHNRSEIVQRIKRVISDSDLLIVTLGLTETWETPSGETLAMCPGTLKGAFDSDKHKFHNLNYSEVYDDLNNIEHLIRNFSDRTDLLISVSPVPLTATASEDHVLEATIYSKGVLRAAIGDIAKASKNINYLPSYELITHINKGDYRFSDNLRSVSKAGINYVMDTVLRSDYEVYKKEIFSPLSEELCSDQQLENFNTSKNVSSKDATVFLIGDSHLQRLSEALKDQNINVHGGMIMPGSSFADNKFKLSKGSVIEFEEEAGNLALWKDTYENLNAAKGSAIIITNIGIQAHVLIPKICNKFVRGLLSKSDVGKYFHEYCSDQTSILKHLSKYGKVSFVEDPNFYVFNMHKKFTTQRYNFEVCAHYMKDFTSCNNINYYSLGREIMVEISGNSGDIAPAVASDGIHGSPEYYKILAKKLLEQLPINQG